VKFALKHQVLEDEGFASFPPQSLTQLLGKVRNRLLPKGISQILSNLPIAANTSLKDITALKAFEHLNILCVEDNQVNQSHVRALIEPDINHLYFAKDGQEAINVLNKFPVDVVLMDIRMPYMEGIETTLEIRGSDTVFSEIIIIALMENLDSWQRRILQNIGLDDTIAKPVKREDILDAFDRTLSKFSNEYGQSVTLSA